MNQRYQVILSVVCTIARGLPACGQPQSKPATDTTKAANAAVLQHLDFAHKQDFEDAQRGLRSPSGPDLCVRVCTEPRLLVAVVFAELFFFPLSSCPPTLDRS
jgi:hypothetical protein